MQAPEPKSLVAVSVKASVPEAGRGPEGLKGGHPTAGRELAPSGELKELAPSGELKAIGEWREKEKTWPKRSPTDGWARRRLGQGGGGW